MNRDIKTINDLCDKRMVKKFDKSFGKNEMSLFDFVTRRKNIVYRQSEGINLAVNLINEYKERTFIFKGLKNKYFGLSGENLLERIREELDNMLILYHYTTKVKEYTDRKGVPHVEIKSSGNTSMMSRYNPLDIELDIKTEMPLIHPELEK